VGDGRAEVGHDRIADELVDRSAVLEDAVRDHLEDLVQQGDHVGRLHPLGESREAPDVGEQDRDLAFDARLLLALGALEQLGEDVVVDVAAEGVLDALLLCQGVSHLVEGARQLAHLVVRSRRHAHHDLPGAHLLHAVAQPLQRVDEQRDEDHAGEDAEGEKEHGGGRELPLIVPHDPVDEDPAVELELGFSEPDIAVPDRRRAQDP
jgi:hypothetical protein